ncbi:hypothetical protein MYRA21_3338 [Myroides sp. A21]|uniref:hypothetical protein n=1 Tax=Myroides sp. A21 TaxID=1583100 RepID=UPI000585E7EF|nr:hypothetical protein [Myroides sp. A21]AJA70431.1 hypothetical protein MYRA21_3338 [Myroides sp. A21]
MSFLNKVIRYIVVVAILCLSHITMYGQVNKTMGTRITDVITDKEVRTNAILDLESTSKGFFLPRMTTIQRDAIKKEMGKDNGLAVYNIDNDCVEYWSERASKWMSLCGTLPPAKLDLAEDSCESISFTGFNIVDEKPLLQQGVALDPTKQFMIVKLKVNQVGTFTISASGNNGYFFSGEGQFQAIGTYEVVLKAMGTPIKGYDQTGSIRGDKLQFTVNGIDSKVCTNTELRVEPAELDFKIGSKVYFATKKYNVGIPTSLKSGHKIEIDIEVKSGGLATVVATNKRLGMKFIASKKVTPADKILILEPVEGENIPVENDIDPYEFIFEVNTKNPITTINGSKAQLKVEETELKALFTDINLGKEPYYQGENLNEKHTLELPIEVINSGYATLSLSNGQGILFKSERVMLAMPSENAKTQIVKFTAVKGGILPKSEFVNLTLKGDGKRFNIVDGTEYNLPLEKKPVAYTIDCSSVKSNRGAIPYNKVIGDSYYIIAKVNVTVPGEYEINTSAPVDGILFSTSKDGVKQVFTNTGIQEVILHPVDKTVIPTQRGEYSVNLVANDMSNSSCSGIKVKVGYGDINVLILKNARNGDSNEALFFTGKNRNGKARFGEDGVFVETGEVKVTTYDTYRDNNEMNRVQILKDIKAKKYNFIMISGQYGIGALDKDIADAIYNYTINDEGIFFMYTTYLHENKNLKGDYIKIIGEEIKGQYIGEINEPYGLELIKRFNKDQSLEVQSYAYDRGFKTYVHNISEPLTSEKSGYKYHTINKVYKNVHWYYRSEVDDGYKPAFDATNTEYRPLITDRGNEKRGTVFVHKKYENLIWAPIGSSWYDGMFVNGAYIDAATGEVYKDDFNRTSASTDNAPFTANLFIELISRLANK